MTARTDSAPLPAPPSPLPPDRRADIAYRRARGASWEAIGAAFRYDPDALRRLLADDAAFALSLEAAEAAAVRETELKALQRLNRLTDSDDERIAVRAAAVLVRYARERRREARAVEPTKTEAKPQEAKGESVRPETTEKRVIPKGLISPPRSPGAFRAVPFSVLDQAASLR